MRARLGLERLGLRQVRLRLLGLRRERLVVRRLEQVLLELRAPLSPEPRERSELRPQRDCILMRGRLEPRQRPEWPGPRAEAYGGAEA